MDTWRHSPFIGLDGLESLITALAVGSGIDAPTIRRFRGWTEEEWDEGVERLRDRGILDAAGALTAQGRSLRTRRGGDDRHARRRRLGVDGPPET